MIFMADILAGLGLNSTLIMMATNEYFQHLLSIADTTYLQLLVSTLGLFLYAIFVWKFYRGLARRDLFAINLEKYDLDKYGALKKAGSAFLYILKYLIIFPLYITFWFAVMTLFLVLLGEEMVINQIIIVSIVIISGVRVTSYFKEELATDMAKLLPFALLAVLLINPNFFSFDMFYERVMQSTALLPSILDFFIFAIVLEFILRLLYGIKVSIVK